LTGPAPGKIRLRGIVRLLGDGKHNVDCEIYLHVKGYSLARVTHVDLENPIFNEFLKPKSSLYAPFKIKESKLIIFLKKSVYMRSLGFNVNRLIVYSPELTSALGEGSYSYVYIGGKVGGIFLGFKKDFVRRLEKLAVKYGYEPL